MKSSQCFWTRDLNNIQIPSQTIYIATLNWAPEFNMKRSVIDLPFELIVKLITGFAMFASGLSSIHSLYH